MKNIVRIIFLLMGSSVYASSFEEMAAKYQIQESHFLAYYNNLELLAQVIIDHEETVNARDLYGNTALHYASYYDRKSIVKMLLDNGAFVDTKNHLGHTPLFLASMKCHQGVMICLCEHDADIFAENHNGQTPISISNDNAKEILYTVSSTHKQSK
jgi:ankyrin repeat protein